MKAPAPPAAPLLVETKFHAPRRRRDVVHRGRLTGRLVRQEQPPLTLVSAPAGFGKTTLLTEWFDDDASTAWLSLDAGDNDAARFWSYVVAALRTVDPTIGEAATSLLQADGSAIEAAAATLLNDLGAMTRSVVLVLDDYHVIESVDVHESVAFLLEHVPSNFHVVIASRSDPPLRLARMRARGELLEVRAAELRFTTEEAASYLHDAMGLELAVRDVEALEARTEGWIAALQLAALSLQGRTDVAEFIAGFTGDDRFVVDYLVEEVLDRQTEDVRTFLLHTAILGRLSASLCDAVTARSDGASVLARLEKANLFVVPLDDQRRWYRYHHLFADVLRARLAGERQFDVPQLHRRAAAWYEAHGDHGEAISHAMAGGEFEKVARLVELAAPAMRRSRQEMALRGWLEALPAGLFDRRPVLAILLVGARMGTGDTTGVEPLLDSVEGWLDGTRRDEPVVYDEDELARLPAQVAMYRAGLALMAGDIEGTIRHASRIFEVADQTDHVRRGGGAALTGLAQWATGNLEPARRSYADAVERFTRADFIPDVLGCSLALADIQLAQGRLGDARRTYERGLQLAHDRPGLRGTADMHVGLCELHLERNDLTAAARHLQASREHGDRAGLPQNAYRWRVAAARLHHAQGNTVTALGELDEAERFYDTDFSPAIRPIPALRAHMQLDRGVVAAAVAWAEGRGLHTDDELAYLHEYEHLTFARTLIAAGPTDRTRLDVAISFLHRLLTAANQGDRAGSAIESLVLLSKAHRLRGDDATAHAHLVEGLDRAATHGFVRVFLEDAAIIRAALASGTLPPTAAGHATHVLSTTLPQPAAPSSTGLVEALSIRELDVLRLLRTDLSGPEIARELLVSLNTFRTHTKNIYAKLGVNNRREAARRAAELGL